MISKMISLMTRTQNEGINNNVTIFIQNSHVYESLEIISIIISYKNDRFSMKNLISH